MPRPRGRRQAPSRGRQRGPLHAARGAGTGYDVHRERASDSGPRPPARHGQNGRAIALGRKNYLFAGSDAGGRRAAILYTLIQTATLNGLDPEAYLRDILARIADHPINQIDDLLPWYWPGAPTTISTAA